MAALFLAASNRQRASVQQLICDVLGHPFGIGCQGVADRLSFGDLRLFGFGFGTVSREFDHGTAVYNPLGNRLVTVRFPELRRSLATGKVDEEHSVGCPDGDIFVRLK